MIELLRTRCAQPPAGDIFSQCLTGYSGFDKASGDLGNIDNNYQLDDGVNSVHGNHNLQFGGSIRYRRTWQQNANAGAVGNLTFQPLFTSQLTLNTKG